MISCSRSVFRLPGNIVDIYLAAEQPFQTLLSFLCSSHILVPVSFTYFLSTNTFQFSWIMNADLEKHLLSRTQRPIPLPDDFYKRIVDRNPPEDMELANSMFFLNSSKYEAISVFKIESSRNNEEEISKIAEEIVGKSEPAINEAARRLVCLFLTHFFFYRSTKERSNSFRQLLRVLLPAVPCSIISCQSTSTRPNSFRKLRKIWRDSVKKPTDLPDNQKFQSIYCTKSFVHRSFYVSFRTVSAVGHRQHKAPSATAGQTVPL